MGGIESSVTIIPQDRAERVQLIHRRIDDPDHHYKRHSIWINVAIKLFYICCFCTGQYTPHWTTQGESKSIARSKWWIIPFYICSGSLLLVGILLNSYAFGFDILAIICFFSHTRCDFIYTETNSSLQNIYQTLTISTNQFNNWQKAVTTTATVSGTMSYIFIVLVLYGQYSFFLKWYIKFKRLRCCTEPLHHRKQETANKIIVLNPFLDCPYNVNAIVTEGTNSNELEDDDFIYLPTSITPKQSSYFLFIFFFNLIVFGLTVGLLVIIVVRNIGSRILYLEALDIFGFFTQYFSQFCAILSCFLFSKVSYAVSNRCLDFSQCIFKEADISTTGRQWEDLINEFQFRERENVTHLEVLKKMDQMYVKLVKNSLTPYGTWFAIHWVLYTVTAFMSIAYFIDQVEIHLYGNGKCHNPILPMDELDCELVLAYSFFFAIEHCVLFLYPCFRAASVTQARNQMIKYVSSKEWTHVLETDINSFVTYLEYQNCTFKVSILCAELSFGFNMAYISIFIGALGLIFKVSL